MRIRATGVTMIVVALILSACGGPVATQLPAASPTATAAGASATPTAAGASATPTAAGASATPTAAGASATPTSAAASPTPVPPDLPNVEGLVFTTTESAMLAGYAAASWSKTKVMGTFGGINIGGPVTDFMSGFVAGANYWNAQKTDTVKVLGWDPIAKTGSFTGDFTSTDNGKNLANSQIQENADVLLGVGGPIGQGIYDAIRENDVTAVGVGVDVDWFISDPEDKNLILTSILKRIDNAVHAAVKRVYDVSDNKGDAFHACQISDTGGTDDKSFNANAWQGMQDAQTELGVKIDFLDSATSDDYARNIQTFIDSPCDIIVTVGFLLGDATQAAAIANPDQKFAIVDYAYAKSAVFVNTLANGGVDLGPFHDYEDQISTATKAELLTLRGAIIDGSVKPADFFAAAP